MNTAAISKGPKTVMIKNDFFFTLVRYSRLSMSRIFSMQDSGLLVFVHFINENIVHGWQYLMKREYHDMG